MNLELLRQMSHSKLTNYVIPGLSSSLLGQKHPQLGCVRLFECNRDHEDYVVPHSHRFNFQCLVLTGSVCNTTWQQDDSGDQFAITELTYQGKPGSYTERGGAVALFKPLCKWYKEGEWYGMLRDEIHSIAFSRGTSVLFFEGPELTPYTKILEPFVDGKRVPTFRVKPWMFQKEFKS